MGERLNEINERAAKALKKLNQKDFSELNLKVKEAKRNINKSLSIEEAYYNMTGNLLEPVIARFWIKSGSL